MEDDDEFGDLYSDVLPPLTASFQPQEPDVNFKDSSESRPRDLNINSDDEDILYGVGGAANHNYSSSKLNSLGLNSNVENPPPPESRGFDLNLDSDDRLAGNGGDGLEFKPRIVDKDEEGVQQLSQKSNFMEDDDIDIVVDERENKNDDFVEKGSDFMDKKEIIEESRTKFVDETVVGEIGAEQMIPGLSGTLGNDNRGSNLEDEWESEDSEDDLQIVLNDNNHCPKGMDRMMGLNDEDDDEDEQELVIVSDNGDVGNHHTMMEAQDWAGDEGGPGVDGERKELGDAAKAGGGPAALAAAQPKVAYGGHAYQNSFHSQFKYVRPGAAPIPGAAPVPSAGMPGQVRPPVTMTPAAGRGRGDWRPAGVRGTVPIHKGLQPGYGMPAWGHNTAGRGYGSGLDFTLPSHKTIFEVDIDSFEEKPWRLSGIDVSDFFNFGLNEDSWKDYCKLLEHLRLETTMQSKIRVYESGRAEQDNDPDLPPELAAAVGIQDIPSDNANAGRPDAGTIDLARSSERGRPSLPVGRAIPVETGSGDRLPSIDTRRPRMHDTDAIIEIFCHSSTDDDDMAEQQDNGSRREDLGGGDESDDLQQDVAEHMDNLSPAYNDRLREVVARRAQSKKTVSNGDNLRKDALHSPPQAPGEYHSGSEIGVSDEERSTKGKGRAGSAVLTASDDKSEKHSTGDRNEESGGPENATQDPRMSSSRAIESGDDEALVDRDDMNDESAMDDRSLDMDREGIDVDGTTRVTSEDDNLMNLAKKQKLSSHAEQVSQESESREDAKAARSSGNSRRRSGSSRDDRRFTDSIEDEVVQERHPPRVVDTQRTLEDVKIARRKGSGESDETGRHHKLSKGREDSYSRRGGDLSSSLHRNVRSESADWRKESDMYEGSWNWREDYHGRRFRVEEPRKREHGGETGSRNRDKVRENERSEKDEYHQSRNQLDNGSHRVRNHDQYNGSRKRDRDDILKGRNERLDDLRSKQRKEEVHLSGEYGLKEEISYNHIESGPRKRERNDGPDLRRRDDQARLKDGNVHYVEQMEETSFQRERSDRRRQSDDWHRPKQDENLSRREREDTQSLMRSSRAGEDKTRISHARGKDDYRGSGRQYHKKEVGRNGDQLRRRDSVENEDFSLRRSSDESYARGIQLSNYDKSARYERHSTGDERVAYTSDASGLHEHKQKESTRKSKGSERGHHTSLSRSRRKQDEHSVQISEKVNSEGKMEQQSGENDMHVNHLSSRKHHKEEEGLSDGEQAASSMKGRSKLECWTSHKERDLTSSIPSSSSLKTKDVLDTHNNRGEEPSKKIDEKSQPSVDGKEAAAEVNNNNNNNYVDPKVIEGKHLDTVEKLKKRSERFKLPLPSEKDPVAIKEMESEPLPSAHAETRADSEIKSERPPRKRRWTGN